MTTTKVWNKESIQHLLQVSDKAVANAILALYARQTSDEQASEGTHHHNGRGFNSRDAAFLSSIAKALPRYSNHMTPRQLKAARAMLPKYWRQLLEVAGEKGAVIETKVSKRTASIDQVIAHQETRNIRDNPNFARF